MSQRHAGQIILDEPVPSSHPYDGNAAEERPRVASGGLGEHLIQKLFAYSRARALVGEAGSSPSSLSPIAIEKDSPVALTSQGPLKLESSSIVAPLTPQVSIDSHGNTYPEGGLRAWLVVYGSFSGMTASFGLMNTVGTYQAYLSTHQLSNMDPSVVGWIFSLYTFLAFFCGVQIGPIFDNKGPRGLMLAGTICLVGGTFGIAESTELWHFILSFSIAAGLGTSLIFTPAVSSVAHFFLLKRAAATGLATTGGSIGGIVFPLMLQKLFVQVGFRWATRTMAFVFLFQLIVANMLVRSRLPPPPKGQGGSIWPDFRIFRDKTLCLTTAGTFFVEWALFIPLAFITSYAISRGVDEAFSYQLLAILNAGSFFGRWVPGYYADHLGRFNMMIATIFMCLISVLCLWLTAYSSTHLVPQLIIFVLIFGFASGSNISLVPVCVGQLCATEVFGRWYAGLYTIVSFGCLTGIPIAGSILSKGNGNYTGLMLFVGACYAAGLVCFVFARIGKIGWRLTAIY